MTTDYIKEKLENMFPELSAIFEKYTKITVLENICQKDDYAITIKDNNVLVSIKKNTYLGHALFVLSSLQLPNPMASSCQFKDFGLMIDMARNAVLKVQQFKQMIRYAAYFGYQYIGLYVEDVLKVRNEPYFGYMRGAYNSNELKEIISYASIYGIEIRPFIQTLAHYNQITRYGEYANHIDTDDILLCDDERVYVLLDNIFQTISTTFTTRKINIGMDEAMMVGRGKYLDNHQYTSKSEVMLKHLDVVNSIAHKYGFTCQMYSDMFEHSKETVVVPNDVELAYWDYYSTDKTHYLERIDNNLQLTSNLAMFVGAWKWTGFFPHNQYAISACINAMMASLERNIQNYCVTMWGDDGAECSIFSVLPTLYQVACHAYAKDTSVDAFKVVVGMTYDEMLLLDEGNPYVSNKTHNNASKYLLYDDVLMGIFESVVKNDTAQHFEKMKNKYCDLYHKYENTTFGYLFESAYKLMNVLQYKVGLSKKIYMSYQAKDLQALKDIVSNELYFLIPSLEEYYTSFQTQWHIENKSFGFEVETIRLGGLIQRLKDCRKELWKYCNGEIDAIDILEEERLPLGYVGSDDISSLNYNLYREIVTTNVM